jgi:hypothetical protein
MEIKNMTQRKKIDWIDANLTLPFELKSEVGEIAKKRGKTRNDVMRIWIETGVLNEKKMNRR